MSDNNYYKYIDSDGVMLELNSGKEHPFIEITAATNYPYTSVFVPQRHAFELMKRLSRTIHDYNEDLSINENAAKLRESTIHQEVLREFGIEDKEPQEFSELEQTLIKSIVAKRISLV